MASVVTSAPADLLPKRLSLLCFADLELDLRRYELRRDGRVLKLERIPMDLLVFLVEERGRLVPREEIIERIWGKDVFIDTENAINTAVRKVRQALKDHPARPQLLETVPGKGYRFIAQVTTAQETKAADSAEPARGFGGSRLASGAMRTNPLAFPETLKPRRRSRQRLIFAGCAVGAMLLSAFGLVTWQEQRPSRNSPHTISSLGVLPLENLSGDPSQEYFSEGLTDELTTNLAKLHGLRVISRTSAMRYKGTRKPLPEIAHELNVDAVVEGTVLRSANRVRIDVQLIDARTDKHLWAEVYERDLRDVLSLQSEVTGAIARQINLELTPQQKARFSNAQVPNFEAYAAYLKGRYEWNKRTPESLKKSIQYLEEAIAKDRNYALAHEGLAETYNVLSDYDVLTPGESYSKAKAEALKALQLDDGLGEAHATLASVKEEFEWDWLGADQEFKRAIELSPSYATAHQWYSEYLLRVGRLDEGLAEMQRAQQLDPGSPLMNAEMGGAFYWARQYDKSIQQLGKAIEMEPRFAYAHSWLGFAYEKKGMRQKAIEEFQKAVELSGGSPGFRAALGHAYGLAGNRPEARKIAEKLTVLFLSKQFYVSPYDMAIIYTGLGEKDQAFDWLERAYAVHDPALDMLKVEPALDGLRSDPRFEALIHRIGLTS